ncbi:MAG TPA: HAD-IA family hydrolase [Acidimicrobiia bacterium]|nr:HAD-IA family hydrolase [Acidimicrobiia bacterium]
MSAEGTTVDAVTFDFWNTICREPPGGYLRGRRLEAMSQVLVDAGVGSAGVVLPVLTEGYDAAWRGWNDAWRANRQFTGVDAAHFICDRLEATFDGCAEIRPLVLEAFAGQGEGAALTLVDGVADALAALSARGVRLGIICDVGFTPSPALLAHLDRFGVRGYFDHWSFSDEVGWYKPDRRIFEHALAGLGGPDPRRCAHVGDRRRTDVAGARALGMRAVRINAAYEDTDDEPDGDAVITSYADLLPALGLG